MRPGFIDGPIHPGGAAPSLTALLSRFGGVAFDARSGETLLPGDLRLERAPRDVHQDSRRVGPGDIFAGLPGLRVNGACFVPEVLGRGALAALVPEDAEIDDLADVRVAPEGGILWRHPRATELVGALATRVYGRPDVTLDLVGITGTNGKTSVAHLAGEVLTHAGRRPAVLGTAGHRLAGPAGPVELPASHTTPEVTELVRLLARHQRAGGDSGLMEVSSHALVQGRVQGLELKVGAFTNLTREHLDYHGSMADYGRAKARLWDHIRPGGTAVIAGDGDGARRMLTAAAARGLKVLDVAIEGDAAITARDLERFAGGTRLTLHGLLPEPARLALPLEGEHNVQNALVAAGIASSLGCSPAVIVAALSQVTAPPGRLEPVRLPSGLRGAPFEVFVDFAHSPDALERVLTALRARMDGSGAGRLICVFGCGGDRDPGKRIPMGQAAGRLADVVFVTSDNPRTEDPARIAQAVAEGVEAERGAAPYLELDRRRAIAAALSMAGAGDVLLIAGKGHETTQTVGDAALPFDDRTVAAELLDELAQRRCAS
ncbi:UDP-N-acetylmuramoyl-L-alanyl-D-glutamate--2,6-diaminopimelate ligase [Planctomycetota bacterium]|nr:UDP-N-acetylmuramoyl-L-alanyl-D-glutamate--2,6-diaminopimelate ligase [Planctomycetota bacterium]